MIKIKIIEEAKVWNEYTIELTNEYVSNLNTYLQKRFEPVDAEKILYFDAELLAIIYRNEGRIKSINIDLEDIGRKPYQDIKVQYNEFECYYSLLDMVVDTLNEDIWNTDYETIDFQTLDYEKKVEGREEN